MAQNLVINGITYNGVKSLEFVNEKGEKVLFYDSAVLYTEQELTEAQKEQARQNIGVPNEEDIVQQVITALGTPVFGTVDENCHINLTGKLADGKTYTFTYEDENGVVSTIGTYTKTNVPKYTNQISTSIDTDGSIYNGTGYIEKRRLNSSGNIVELSNTNATNPVFVTGFIKIKPNDVIRLKNCYIDTVDSEKGAIYGIPTYSGYVRFYDSNFTYKNGAVWTNFRVGGTVYMLTDQVTDSNGICTGFTVKSDAAYPYMRICLVPTGDVSQAILTINEEIVD